MPSRLNLTLVLPSLLWPHSNIPVPAMVLPGLNALRQQGKYTSLPCDRHHLYQQFLWHGSWLAQAKQQAGLDKNQFCLIATPLSQEAGMHQVQCEFGHSLALTFDEARNFCSVLNEWFANDHWQFIPIQPDLWLVSIPRQLDISQSSILDLHGVIDITNKPQGMDAASLLQKQTEWQMFLYQHPLNQQRLARGLPPINDIWLQPDSIGQRPITASLYSNNSWAQQAQPLPSDWEALQHQCDTHIIVCMDDLCAMVDQGDVFSYADMLSQWDQCWWQPLWQSFQAHHIAQLSIICDGEYGGCLAIQPSLFTWLRRKKPVFDGHKL